jgi:hypothetical protein
VRKILIGRDNIVGPWVCRLAGGTWTPGRGSTIGLLDEDDLLLAGVLYEDFNGANLLMHCAAVSGGQWLNREFLHCCFRYPFQQLGCKRVSGIVPSSNTAARRFDEHLGFKLEATLKDAHPEGDLLVYVMHKQDCRWLHLKEKGYGKEQRAGDAGLRRAGDCDSQRREVQRGLADRKYLLGY